MTGAEFASAGERLALAHAAIRPDGAAWLIAWRADKPAAAEEMAEWELKGHPFTNRPPRIALRVRLEQTVERLIALLDALDETRISRTAPMPSHRSVRRKATINSSSGCAASTPI